MLFEVYTFWCFVILILCLKVNNIATETGPYHGKTVVCYWATWSTYRPGRGKFQLENIDPNLCTHLIFAFALLDDTSDTLKFLDRWSALNVDEDNRNGITKLKERHPHLKVLMAIGGWQDGSMKYSAMAADPERRRNFVNNTVEFLKEHNFDGLDLVWEFPTKRGGSISDKVNFVQLVKDLKTEYQKENFILTAAFGASKDTIDNGYDVPELSEYLDSIHMMSYDYSGSWSRVIGPNAPLHGPNLLNVEYSIKHMLKLGADPSKLILGVPFYGRTFLRSAPSNSSLSLEPRLGEKFKNYSFNGSYTQEEGFMGYNEICLELYQRSSEWKLYWDDESKTPYAVNGEKLIVYDNDRSVTEKIKFAMRNDLGGVMVWAVDTDDFLGDCFEIIEGRKEYPLLRTIDREIHRFVSSRLENIIENNPKASSVQKNGCSILKLNRYAIFVLVLVNCCINAMTIKNILL